MNAEGDFKLQDLSGIIRRRGKVAGFTALGVVLVVFAFASPSHADSLGAVQLIDSLDGEATHRQALAPIPLHPKG